MSICIACPRCGFDDTRIMDARPVEDATQCRRRRKCRACSYRFTTREMIESDDTESYWLRAQRFLATLKNIRFQLEPLVEFIEHQIGKLENGNASKPNPPRPPIDSQSEAVKEKYKGLI